MKKLYWGIAVLVLMSPLGLLVQGTPWGEWSLDEFEQTLGFVPAGMRALESFWRAPLSGYEVFGGQTLLAAFVGYLISAAVGVGSIVLVFKVLGCFLSETSESEDTGDNT